MAPILHSMKTSRDDMANKNVIRTYPAYEFSFGSSFARVGRLGAENNFHLSHYYVVSYCYIIIL